MRKVAALFIATLVTFGILQPVAQAQTIVGYIYMYEENWYDGYMWQRKTATLGIGVCHRITGPGNVFRSVENMSSHHILVSWANDCNPDSYGRMLEPYERVPSFPWSTGAKSIKVYT